MAAWAVVAPVPPPATPTVPLSVGLPAMPSALQSIWQTGHQALPLRCSRSTLDELPHRLARHSLAVARRRVAGAPKGNKNALKHGRYTAEAIANRRGLSTLLRTMKALAALRD
jgi:hypothetical protein